jgi:hypothetical protein
MVLLELKFHQNRHYMLSDFLQNFVAFYKDGAELFTHVHNVMKPEPSVQALSGQSSDLLGLLGERSIIQIVMTEEQRVHDIRTRPDTHRPRSLWREYPNLGKG